MNSLTSRVRIEHLLMWALFKIIYHTENPFILFIYKRLGNVFWFLMEHQLRCANCLDPVSKKYLFYHKIICDKRWDKYTREIAYGKDLIYKRLV